MTTTEKEIVSDFARGADWLTDGNNNFSRIRRMLLNQWSNKLSTTTGLTYGYVGGVGDSGAAFTMVADGTIALTDNATNYVERTAAGVVSTNTTGFTYGTKVPMAKVTTVSGAITNHEDWRFYAPVASSGGGGGSGGKVAQVVYTQTGAEAHGSTLIPADDTIPQSTEGDQYFSLAITPTNASSILRIECVGVWGSGLSSAVLTVALFQDAGAGAIAIAADLIGNSGASQPIVLRHHMTAGTTSATTFTIRAGVNAGSVILNGVAGPTRRFGGVSASSLEITEILP
jgi:hypothetical protein